MALVKVTQYSDSNTVDHDLDNPVHKLARLEGDALIDASIKLLLIIQSTISECTPHINFTHSYVILRILLQAARLAGLASGGKAVMWRW